MRATIPFLEERFAEFNDRMFSGRLPQVRLRLSRARTYLGQLRWQKRRSLLRRAKITSITLSISTLYDLPQDELEDTLLHEMIHLHILVCNLRDSSAHGPLFRAKMRDFNERFGRHITISHRLTEQQCNQAAPSSGLRRKTADAAVCVSRLSDGRCGVTVAMPAAVEMLRRLIPQLPEVESARWYLTSDSYFDRFPRSRTVKIYLADAAEIEEALFGNVER